MGVGRGGTLTGAVFLDRDGVIVEPVVGAHTGGRAEAVHDPADVRLVAGAVDGIRALRAAGWLLIGVSNQPGAAKGQTTPAVLAAVQQEVERLLSVAGAALDDWRFCFHHPDAVDPALRGCDCRKPAPGMLLDAAAAHAVDLAASWMVGDTDADIGAGRAAGTRTMLVAHASSAHRRTDASPPDFSAATLAEAATFIGGGR